MLFALGYNKAHYMFHVATAEEQKSGSTFVTSTKVFGQKIPFGIYIWPDHRDNRYKLVCPD